MFWIEENNPQTQQMYSLSRGRRTPSAVQSQGEKVARSYHQVIRLAPRMQVRIAQGTPGQTVQPGNA